MIFLMPGIIVCVLAAVLIEKHVELKKSTAAEIKVPEISPDVTKQT